MLNPKDDLIAIQEGLQLLKGVYENVINKDTSAFRAFMEEKKLTLRIDNLFDDYRFTAESDAPIAATYQQLKSGDENFIETTLDKIQNGTIVERETLNLILQLITLQQEKIAARLASVVSNTEESTEQQADTANTNIDSASKRPLSAYMKPVAAVVSATVGLGMTSLAALVQFNAQVSATFALLVGATLPVSALIAAAVAGMVLMGLAGYLAYQSFYQTPVVPVAPVSSEIAVSEVAPATNETKEEDKGSCFQRACPSLLSMFTREKKDVVGKTAEEASENRFKDLFQNNGLVS